MQSEAPEQSPSALDEDNLSQGNKRRRTSERAARTIPEQPESSNALSTGRRMLTTSSPQRGSSREMTPPEGAGTIKYTRTGRVSKAAKGQRVHQCDECGKTYTRAEHLRRHQQNHKPGVFPCDVPGCGRSFYREDLLIRHKARHNDPLNPPSPGPPSPGSQDSAPVTDQAGQPLSRASGVPPIPAVAEIANEEVEVRPPQVRTGGRQGSNPRTKERYLDINQLDTGHPPVSLHVDSTYPEFGIGALQWDSPPYSPTGYESDFCYPSGPPYYQPHPSRARQSSNASFYGYYPPPHTSRSPVSAGSSTVYLPQWGHSAHDPSFQQLGTSSGSEGSYGNSFGVYNINMVDQQLLPSAFGSSGVLTAEERDSMEQPHLIIPTSTPPGSSLDLSMDEVTYTNEGRYLGAYWLLIHPFFPVVHRPSFVLDNASPLLKAAMLALGGHALRDAADRQNAKIIHERCVKVLKRRTLNTWHTFRPCDMQAVVLIEVYSIFKSRRPPLQFSNHFENVYQNLANDPVAMNPNVSLQSPVYGNTADDSAYLEDFESSASSLDAHVKQRLFLACYVLDQLHATLFGRRRTTCFSGVGTDLPFTRSQGSWDATNEHRMSDESEYSRVWEALDGGNMDERRQHSYDVFQFMLMMACVADSNTDSDSPGYAAHPTRDLSPILSTMEQSPRIKMAYNTLMLCKHTPIRDLLAVAGESWVIGEKLSSQAEYTAAQIESRQWAKGFTDPSMNFSVEQEQAPVNRALRYAWRILELYHNHPRTGLIFQEWSVYLASVVIWARAYVTSNKPPAPGAARLSVSVPKPSEPQPSPNELDQTVSAMIESGPNGNVIIDEAKNILLWTTTMIKEVDIPHNCGLTNGALDVLNKLVARGSEEGWFGS